MSLLVALSAALLTYVGVLLLLRRRLLEVVLGFGVLAHVGNLIVLVSGGIGERAPVLAGPLRGEETVGLADPLPQALVLTAIVISMALLLYLVALRRRVLQHAAEEAGAGKALSDGDGAAGEDEDERAGTASSDGEGAAGEDEDERAGEGESGEGSLR